MTFYDTIKTQLIEHEGRKRYPYRCPAGHLTIGIGRNLNKNPLTEKEIDFLFRRDLDDAVKDLEKIFGHDFMDFSPARRVALTDMRFNLGASGFHTFVQMIGAIKAGNWDRAAEEALNSKWAREDVQPERVDKVVGQLRRG